MEGATAPSYIVGATALPCPAGPTTALAFHPGGDPIACMVRAMALPCPANPIMDQPHSLIAALPSKLHHGANPLPCPANPTTHHSRCLPNDPFLPVKLSLSLSFPLPTPSFLTTPVYGRGEGSASPAAYNAWVPYRGCLINKTRKQILLFYLTV
jgi:hypothetical protein